MEERELRERSRASALVVAAKNGDVSQVESLLEMGLDPNEEDRNKNCALNMAVCHYEDDKDLFLDGEWSGRRSHRAVIDLLINSPDLNISDAIDNLSTLPETSLRNEIIEKLQKREVESLMLVVCKGDIAKVEFLLGRGVDCNQKNSEGLSSLSLAVIHYDVDGQINIDEEFWIERSHGKVIDLLISSSDLNVNDVINDLKKLENSELGKLRDSIIEKLKDKELEHKKTWVERRDDEMGRSIMSDGVAKG